MDKGIFLAYTTCTDDSRQDEFNRWYFQSRVADVVGAEGFTGARRFVNPYPGTPQYMTIYFAEGDDMSLPEAGLRETSRASWAEGRHIECVQSGGLGVYRFIDPAALEPIDRVSNGPYTNTRAVDRDPPDAPPVAKALPRAVFLVATDCSDPSRDDEFNRWYSHMHIPDLSAAKGFVRADRYRRDHAGSAPSDYLTVYEFEGDVFAALNDMLRIARSVFATRHIDCIEGAPEGGLWLEINASAYPPLEKLDYPRRTSGYLP